MICEMAWVAMHWRGLSYVDKRTIYLSDCLEANRPLLLEVVEGCRWRMRHPARNQAGGLLLDRHGGLVGLV